MSSPKLPPGISAEQFRADTAHQQTILLDVLALVDKHRPQTLLEKRTVISSLVSAAVVLATGAGIHPAELLTLMMSCSMYQGSLEDWCRTFERDQLLAAGLPELPAVTS